MLFKCPQYEKERLQLDQVEKEPIKSINDFKNALTCISIFYCFFYLSKKTIENSNELNIPK